MVDTSFSAITCKVFMGFGYRCICAVLEVVISFEDKQQAKTGAGFVLWKSLISKSRERENSHAYE